MAAMNHNPYQAPQTQSWLPKGSKLRLFNYTNDELRAAVANGARCVTFSYCMALYVTFHGQSEVFVVKGWTRRLLVGLPYTLPTFFLGWWSLYGVVLTPWYLLRNLMGGTDLTEAVIFQLDTSLSPCLTTPYFSGVDVQASPQSTEDFLRSLERQQ
jgi:hypothetical protein